MTEGIGYGPVIVVNGVVEKPVWAEEIPRLYLDAFLVEIGVYYLQQRRVEGDLELNAVEIGHVLHQDVNHARASRAYLQRQRIWTYRHSLLCPARGHLS